MEPSRRNMRYDETNTERREMKDAQSPGEYQPFENACTDIPRRKSFDPEDGNRASQIALSSSCAIDIDDETPLSKAKRKQLVQICYLSAAAITGVLLRIMLAQLFGEECKNPGTVGWLKASSPLCVTADGTTEQVEGGIIFADLPANLLGCFFMGLMQDGTTLGLAIPLPVAWLSPLSGFQSMTAIHLAIKTGFCGSLTTFSSWNSDMIVLMFGSGYNRSSQFMSALFGYLIGMETALGSYVFGTTVAKWLHRLVNPELASEADAMRDREAEGVFINRELPELERRFLHQLNVQYDSHIASEQNMVTLARWRETTKEARRVRHPFVEALYQIETAVFVDHECIPQGAEKVGRQEGWDIDALREWKARERLTRLPRTSSSGYLLPHEQSRWYSVAIAGILVGGTILFLILGLIQINEKEDFLITYRTMAYSMLLAPFGALLRWQLSSLNGSWAITEQLAWIPAGTFAANLLGAMVSITMIGAEFYNSDAQNFWVVGTIRAIRVGFAGCLTTVSTFVAEVHKFFHQHKYDRGYLYILITLVTSCVVSIIIYACIVIS